MISDVFHEAAHDIDEYIKNGTYGDPATYKDDKVMIEIIRLREQMLAMRNVLDTVPDDTVRFETNFQQYKSLASADYSELERLAALREDESVEKPE